MEKVMKVNIPEGYEVDVKNSTFENIKFKKKEEILIPTTYIDLGLSSGTLWADRNVGAETNISSGNYFTQSDSKKFNSPTKEQFKELIEQCKWEWDGSLKGYNIVGKNGAYIFLPASGYRLKGLSYRDDYNGYYWTSSLNKNNTDRAYYLYLYPHNIYLEHDYCYYEHCIRPVKTII